MIRRTNSRRTRRILKPLLIVALSILVHLNYCDAFRRISNNWGITKPNRFILDHRNAQHCQNQPEGQNPHSSCVLKLRGGAKKAKKGSVKTKGSNSSTKKRDKKFSATGKTKVGASSEEESNSAMSNMLSKYRKILPLTRIHLTMVGLMTLIGLVLGDEATQEFLALDPIRTIYGLQLWRPFTAAAFLGSPSLSWLFSGYYLFEYGSSLERAYGTAQHLVFLCSNIIMLSILSILTGQPFFAPSLITAMLHVLSRSMPHQKVKWLIFNVPYWSLPYGLMASDVLQAQSAMAALPHILGILSGHVYFFHKFVWPKMGHPDWLVPSQFLRNRLEPDQDGSNKNQSSIDKAKKSRKRSKGRKLGSSRI